MANFQIHPMIPNLNLMVYEVFHNYLQGDNQDPILNVNKILELKGRDF